MQQYPRMFSTPHAPVQRTCKHGRPRSSCVACMGWRYCHHGRWRSNCRECGCGNFCEHQRKRNTCKECHGKSMCAHQRERKNCTECHGASICKHNRRRRTCRECPGPHRCEHGELRYKCSRCDGSAICRTPLCERAHLGPSFRHRCRFCATHAFPHETFAGARQHRTKERLVVDAVRAEFPAFDWVHDRRVEGGCTALRPDLLCQFGSHVVIIEVDEQAHARAGTACEWARLNALAEDLRFQPLVVLRFNPDAYTDAAGVRHRACVRPDARGHLVVAEPDAWRARLECLLARVRHYATGAPAEMLVVEHLFYSRVCLPMGA